MFIEDFRESSEAEAPKQTHLFLLPFLAFWLLAHLRMLRNRQVEKANTNGLILSLRHYVAKISSVNRQSILYKNTQDEKCFEERRNTT